MGFQGGAAVKNLPANAGDVGDAGLIPGSGRSPGGGNGNPVYYSCLKKFCGQRSMAGYIHGVTKRRTLFSTIVSVYASCLSTCL